MDLDERITLAQELIAKREDIDRQLAELFTGAMISKKPRTCKVCGEPGHDARSCPQSPKPE